MIMPLDIMFVRNPITERVEDDYQLPLKRTNVPTVTLQTTWNTYTAPIIISKVKKTE